MTDNSIVQRLLKENFRDIFEALEESGGLLYLNNAINKWLLSIFIQGISDLYIFFIWDMFLLEGNIIIFKTIYAMIIILESHIIKCKTFDQLNNVFNQVPLTLENRGKLAYYLISKKFNFNMEMIKRYRKTLSHQVIKEIVHLGDFRKESKVEEEIEENENKKIICDLDWPICLKEKKNLEKDYDHIILKELGSPNVINNYIDNYEDYQKRENKKDSYNKNEEYYKEIKYVNLLIERKKHFCDSSLMSIRELLPLSSFNIGRAKTTKIKTRKISKDFYKKDVDYDENNIERNMTINKIVFDITKDNQNKINFVKENIEKGL
jgi:hypothetical protein